jgi:hypothetical protein
MILPSAMRKEGAKNSFGDNQFGNAQLGDARRTKRLVRSANIIARHPGGTLPEKFKSPKDLKAFYRLCNGTTVTHEAILSAHREVAFERIAALKRPVLVLHDSTELDYTDHKSVKGLGQIGNGNRKGYITHNSLAVDPENKEAIGLCSQILHHRVKVRENETDAQRCKRKSRESRLWVQGTAGLSGDWNLVDVCDQGGDTFEFLCHEFKSGRRFVIRSAQNRGIFVGHGVREDAQETNLRDHARTLAELGRWTLQVTSRDELKSPKKKGKKRKVKRIAREATMAVSSARVQIKPPATKSGDYEEQPLAMWIVRVWEVNPPKGQERLEWFLLTNEPADSFEAAYQVVEWYECRWVIEEYHKCKKTGCRIESLQFTRQQSLEPAIAITSVAALTLLNLRDASRKPDAKTRPAKELISEDYIAVLSAWRHGKVRDDWSVYDFCYALARLGGHQNRKSDSHPGWIVLWRGWQELQAMMLGADVISELKNCGQT